MPAITATNTRQNEYLYGLDDELNQAMYVLLSQIKQVSRFTAIQNAEVFKPRSGNPYASSSDIAITYDYVSTSPLNSDDELIFDCEYTVDRVFQIALTTKKTVTNRQLIETYGNNFRRLLTQSSLVTGTPPNEERTHFSTAVRKTNDDGTPGTLTPYEYQVVLSASRTLNTNILEEGEAPTAPQNFVTYLFDYVAPLTLITP